MDGGKETVETLLVRVMELEKRLDQRTVAQADALEMAMRIQKDGMSAQKEAMLRAEIATDKRFESVNEFRNQLKDQAAAFISRTEVETRIAVVNEKLDGAINRINIGEGKIGGGYTLWLILGAVTMLAMQAYQIFIKVTP